MKLKILNVVGARPNFMKIAPIIKEMRRYPDKIIPLLVHTGQHFDREMSKLFFKDLNLPEPDFYLGVGTGSHAVQTSKIIERFEKILLKVRPDLVLVVGDVNSTIGCALCAVKMHIPVAHVEAGLRSFNRAMPEEINRILTDTIAEYLFITEKSAGANLLKQGVSRDSTYFVGNVMIDTLLSHKEKACNSTILKKLDLKKRNYAVLTLHRPSNVDERQTLINIFDALNDIQKRIKIVWPVHPRSKKMLDKFKFNGAISRMANLKMVPAMGYLDFLKLMTDSKFVLTDSGGIQEETSVLGIPCLTLRENTERPVTVEEGTNIIVGQDRDKITKESLKIMCGKFKKGRRPRLWDGKAAKRIVKILIREGRK
ncbi:MAG: UDP-N-acetylglucosamine 2-epimerase (non-hydrolyzing) [Candidatus Omnitrophica bacterium]|nr:UDP-N-acetylglucosamine 2-epimerase (non-hydrolyzing) [Candidatus Omnitrophota bacterium]MBU1853067.1 UDP-N-acetylglucosamine 2-epimerase (non-hydrolyzing) [Candidatus Omnitrophota bacterium]